MAAEARRVSRYEPSNSNFGRNNDKFTDLSRKNNSPGQRFTKKQWQQNRYRTGMGNLSEGQGFANKRKQLVIREYRKMRAKDNKMGIDRSDADFVEPSHHLENVNEEEKEDDEEPNANDANSQTKRRRKGKATSFKRAQIEFEQRTEEKKRKRKEIEQGKQERDAAMKRYKEKKLNRIKLLSRRTPKGQPIMKDRMALLLEKIQRMT